MSQLSRKEVEEFMDGIVHGVECELCHLTEYGVRRLTGNGFKVNPCIQCPPVLRKEA